ncbi:hypothetical protein Tco_0714748 [Tanacetum coccineum]
MVTPNKLGPDLNGKAVNETQYRGMIGSLMYLTASRPDIQFSTCLYARYQANPKESYLIAVKRIFRYLKGTPSLGLWYLKCSCFDLKGYSNSDYVGCNMDRKSTSAEAEYVVAIGYCANILWMKSQLTNYDIIYKKGLKLPSAKYVNKDAPVISATPISSVYPSNIVENVADSDDPSYGEDEQTLVGPSLPPHPSASKKLKILGKRKVASGVPGKALPLKVVLDNLNKDKAYAELERKCNKALQDLDKNPLISDMRAEIKTLHGQVDGLHSEYGRLILEEKKWINYEHTLSSLRAKIEGIESERERLKSSEIQLLQEIDSLKQDRAVVVSKVIPDAVMKLVHSDDLGVLIAKLVRSFIIYGRCQAFEEVAAMKEPFVLGKMSGYRPSSKEEYDQAGDALANSSYPFLAEYVISPYASLEQLLSKKPPSL